MNVSRLKLKLHAFCLTLFSFSTLAGIHAQDVDQTNYFNLWKNVYNSELKGLPKSASNYADSIYYLADRNGDTEQKVRAIIYQSKFIFMLDEHGLDKLLNKLKKEVTSNDILSKSLLHSYIASVYNSYKDDNYWKIRNRNETEINSNDYKTWTVKRLNQEIETHFLASIENDKLLKRVPISAVEDLLRNQENSDLFRPTVYDFLVHRIIEFYLDFDYSLQKEQRSFDIEFPKYFTASIRDNPDRISHTRLYKSLALLEDIQLFHKSTNNIAAYLDITIKKLKLIKQYAIFESVDSDFLEVLNKKRQEFISSEYSTLIDYEIAQVYFEQGSSYSSDKDERLKLKKARQVCLSAQERYPGSIGVQKCGIILNKINDLNLTIIVEKYVPSNKPSRALIKYKNIDSLSINIFKINTKLAYVLSKHSYEKIADSLVRTNPKSSKKFKLHDDLDFQVHSTEIPIPELEVGKYFMVASNLGDTSRKILSYGRFQSTNIAMVSVSQTKYQVIDRNNGLPLENAQVLVTSHRRDDRFKYQQTTDELGFFEIKPKSDANYFRALVTYQKDTANFDQIYIYQYEGQNEKEDVEEVYVRPMLFTDRSIYRPSQTVFFKGILTKQQGTTKELVKNEWVDVYIEDSNYDEVGEYLTLKTNEFGSFSGEFKLPKTGTTGEYTIYVEEGTDYDSKLYDEQMDDFEYIEHAISVEEYKRPRFEVKIDPVDTTYSVGDSISIKGNAISFSGSPVSNVAFKYRITRRIQYPSWYYWEDGYRGEAVVIANGIETTGQKGMFEIDFLALPDEEAKKKTLPIFEYTIFVEVTDINGETRDSESSVNCGYHRYKIDINAPNPFDIDNDLILQIGTKNLNGIHVPTNVYVEIYKQKYPSKILRERPWAVPDRPILAEREFDDLYSNDNYKVHLQKEKGQSVFRGRINTSKSDSLVIRGISDWQQGEYIVEATIVDSSRVDVVEQVTIKAISKKDPIVSDGNIFSIQKDRNVYKPGDKLNLKIGTAASDLNVTLFLKSDAKVSEIRVVNLQNEIKSVSIPLPKTNSDQLKVYYTYSCYNAYQSGQIDIPIFKEKTGLKIRTETFRDRLIPGGEEMWSFSITDIENKKVKAELLAGMYDKSLDEFKPHSWRFIEQNENDLYYYDQFRLNDQHSFGTSYFRTNNKFGKSFPSYKQRYAKLNWFGLGIRNFEREQNNYLKTIEIYKEKESEVEVGYDGTIQKGFIAGKVIDENGQGIPGASIQVLGTNRASISDLDGNFLLKSRKGEILQISFVGYDIRDVKIGGFNKLSVQLVPDVQHLEEVVVVGYGSQEKKSLSAAVTEVAELTEEEIAMGFGAEDLAFEQALQGRVAGVSISEHDVISIRGNATVSFDQNLLYVVDGVIVNVADIEKNDVLNMEILRGAAATSIYGAQAANGVVIISTKSGQDKLAEEMRQVKVRTNLNETAFFYPHISAYKKGKYKFSFTTPESLTRWKIQLLAHDSKLQHGQKTLEAVSQKDLMVIPNLPRFLRVDDHIVIQTKVINLTTQKVEGQASLLLINPNTNAAVDSQFQNSVRTRKFQINPNGNTSVSWKIKVPEGLDLVQYKIVAKTDDFSDGESQVLPILPNRQLITETLPVWANASETRDFELEALRNNNSKSLKNHRLTFELTEDPIWYAIKSLPFLMEFPYECAEQTFARYFANTIGSHIISSNPKIKDVINSWMKNGQLISQLDKNEQLKSILIEETPWVRDAKSQAEQQERLARFLEMGKMIKDSETLLTQLFNMQDSNGGYPWFSGGSVSRTITQHIVSGFGHLSELGVDLGAKWTKWRIKSIVKSIKFIDKELSKDYMSMLRRAGDKMNFTDSLTYVKQNNLHFNQIQALYARSFYDTVSVSVKDNASTDYFLRQVEKYWLDYSIHEQAMMALVLSRNDQKVEALEILNSIKERSTESDEIGVYWKSNKSGWNWYQSPIETQALLIELFQYLQPADQDFIEKMKVWLLRNKQTNNWPTTKSTTEAIYALLINREVSLMEGSEVEVKVGGESIDTSSEEKGTGYFQVHWSAPEIDPSMSTVSIVNSKSNTVWGGLYWQYFEDLDQVEQSTSSWTISKQVFLKTNSKDGLILTSLSDSIAPSVGDLLTVRLILKTDRDAQFVHLKDQRASCLEPTDVLSMNKNQDGLSYYQSTRDTGTHFFFDLIKKGTYVFEYNLRVNNGGKFSNGIATLQSMYAPEFSGHSKGVILEVVE